MLLKKWEKLPFEMQTKEVREYYDILAKKRCSLFFKRIFDIIISLIMLVILFPVFLILAIAIKIDSKGPVFYRQIRITQYGKIFKIFKFRTMIENADKVGSLVTTYNDSRVTGVGKLIRKCRLDEICQLINVLCGTMTFVGTRPEVPKYVAQYSPEMLATLLLPAGITSEASIFYEDEDRLLKASDDIDKIYINHVLPQKMLYNLNAIKHYSFWRDIKIMIMTLFFMLGKKFHKGNLSDLTQVPSMVHSSADLQGKYDSEK